MQMVFAHDKRGDWLVKSSVRTPRGRKDTFFVEREYSSDAWFSLPSSRTAHTHTGTDCMSRRTTNNTRNATTVERYWSSS